MLVNDIGTSVSSPAGTGSVARFADNVDNFLRLLTAQLSNQDPLEPIDPTEFTSQLATFTGVEQAIDTNRKLGELISVQTLGQAAAAVSYLGTTIEARGDRAVLREGQAEWTYSLGGNAAATTISIVNERGQTVRTLSGATDSGKHTFVWDGRDDSGTLQPDGAYTIEIVAQDVNNEPVSVTTGFVGRVTEVSFLGGQVVLSVDGTHVALENVTSVRETEAPEAV
jgi:flagellar basal-body rod modification protein FlgD